MKKLFVWFYVTVLTPIGHFFRAIWRWILNKVIRPIGRFFSLRWKIVLVVIVGLSALAGIIYLLLFVVGPAIDKALMPKTDAPEATEVVATVAPTDVLPVSTSVPTEVSTTVVTEEPQVLSVSYTPPGNAIPLLDVSGETKGFFYALNEQDSYVVEYPYQSTLLITVGNAWIGSDTSHETLISDGTIGNIYADICSKQEGCELEVSHYKGGHVGITIVFGGAEVPSETLVGAVNNMFKPSNCGGSGCKTINVYNTSGKPLEFTKEIQASDVDKILIAPEKPYAQVIVGNNGAPSGAEVILDNANNPVGQLYYLTNEDSFVSVPEGYGTIIYCGSKATVDGKDCAPGSALVFNGIPSDGSTPKDLNKTIKIVSSDPTMIRVIMIYSGSFEDQLVQFKVQYPDWNWPD